MIEDELRELREMLKNNSTFFIGKIQRAGISHGAVRMLLFVTRAARLNQLQPGDIVQYTVKKIGHEEAKHFQNAPRKTLEDYEKEFYEKYADAQTDDQKHRIVQTAGQRITLIKLKKFLEEQGKPEFLKSLCSIKKDGIHLPEIEDGTKPVSDGSILPATS